MNQIRCVICGEEWFADLDMLPWEQELFRKGAGCPCCLGVEPDPPWHPESVLDCENGNGDPYDRILAYENRDKRPKWERPPDEILWTCAGCGVQVIKNPDDGELEYNLPYGAKGHSWYNSHQYHTGCPEEEPAHTFGPDQDVCEFCLTSCTVCNAPLCDTLEYGDTYDDGQPFHNETYGCGVDDGLCIECFENLCQECGYVAEDCHCEEENTDEEGEDE